MSFKWQRFDGVKKIDCSYGMRYFAVVHGRGTYRGEPWPPNTELQTRTLKEAFELAEELLSLSPETYFSAEIYRNEGKYFERDFRKIFDGFAEEGK